MIWRVEKWLVFFRIETINQKGWSIINELIQHASNEAWGPGGMKRSIILRHFYLLAALRKDISRKKWQPNVDMGGTPKIGDFSPKMDDENNGKPYEQMDDLEENPLFLGNIHMLRNVDGSEMLARNRNIYIYKTS